MKNSLIARLAGALNADPCISRTEQEVSKARGRPQDPRSQETDGEQGSSRVQLTASPARTVDRAAPRARARIAQGGVGRQRGSTAMAEEVYVGIDVSKAELVVAVRPT